MLQPFQGIFISDFIKTTVKVKYICVLNYLIHRCKTSLIGKVKNNSKELKKKKYPTLQLPYTIYRKSIVWSSECMQLPEGIEISPIFHIIPIDSENRAGTRACCLLRLSLCLFVCLIISCLPAIFKVFRLNTTHWYIYDQEHDPKH